MLEAGAQTLRLGSDSVSLPRLATGATGAWRAENVPVSESDPVFERITFAPKSLAVMVKLSYELYEDMIDGSGELIDAELINALTLEVDRVALRGSGSGAEPAGLKNIAGVDELAAGAGLDYSDLMGAVAAILADNLEPTAAIMSSRDFMKLGGLADTTGQPLTPPRPVQDLKFLITNQIPTNLGAGTNESEIYVGDFGQLIIGVRPYVRVEVQKHGGPLDVALKATSERYIENMQIAILAAVRADVQVLHPEAFQILTGTLA